MLQINLKTCYKLNLNWLLNDSTSFMYLFVPRLIFFSINIVGRIFQWIRYDTYIYFNLPIVNKPVLFIAGTIIAFFLKNGKIFFISTDLIKNNEILIYLLKIRYPSIFNKRGFLIHTKICYKKRGKITNYITNKL